MKRKITLATMLLIFTGVSFAQYGEITNGDFEDWSTVMIYDYPDQWTSSNNAEWRGVPGVEKSTDASDGTYSVKLNSSTTPGNDTIFGYVYHGSVGSMGPDGGISYTSTFDEITFDYKSSLGMGDSLFIFMIRFSSGSIVDMQVIPAAYGTHTAWTTQSINVSSTAQDELFFGFIMGNPNVEDFVNPGGWALVDNVVLKNGGTAVTDLPDNSFESWSSQSYEGPDDWYTLNDILAGFGSENVNKSTDANTGTYAVELSTILEPNFGDTIPGFLSMGPINMMGGSGSPFLPIAYDAVPALFTGAYKYTPSNGDEGVLYLQFYNNGSVVGGHVETLYSTTGYQMINAPLVMSLTPDSILLVVSSGDNPGSVLLVDDLVLSGGNVSIFENDEVDVEMYPNPASGYFILNIREEYAYEIYSMEGRRVGNNSGLVGWESVDVSSLAAGKYIVKISTEDRLINKVLVVR